MCGLSSYERLARVCLVALISAVAFIGPSLADTIAVGGWSSQPDPNSGIFATAKLIDSTAVLWKLPGGPPDAFRYKFIEDAVYDNARTAAIGGSPVTLLGYSHGATLVVRVAHRLSHTENVPLNLVTLVTIDRIALKYPLEPSDPPNYAFVPDGLHFAFNIFQKAEQLHGDQLAGAVNRDVTNQLIFEYQKGKRANPGDRRFAARYHVFMHNSDHVRRIILGLSIFNRKYLPGLWQIKVAGTIDGRTPRNFTHYYMLYLSPPTDFEAKLKTAGGTFIKFSGSIRGLWVAGVFTIPTAPPGECPNLSSNEASGTFIGSIGEGYNTFKFSLNGRWPGYKVPPTCQWAGMFSFSGNATGVVGLVGSSSVKQQEEWFIEGQEDLNFPVPE